MNFKIVTDSSADIKSITSVPFVSVPLKIRAGEREFVDDETLDLSEMLSYLEAYKGKSSSACPNVTEWKEAFAGATYVFAVTITSGLSGSYNSAAVAAKEYMQEHPECQVHVIDSLSTGAENALVIERLEQLIGEGLSFDEIKEKIVEYQKKTHLIFALESMHNLANNGRVSPLVAKIAGVLGIRVVGIASAVGTLEIESKARGVKNMYRDILATMDKLGYRGGRVRIHHCENEGAASVLRESILSRYPAAKITLDTVGGLCGFYAERGGVLLGFECE